MSKQRGRNRVRKMQHPKSIYLDGERAWEVIEYGLDNDVLYPKEMLYDETNIRNEDWLLASLLPGEEYACIGETGGDYVITSLGRVMNCKLKNVLRAYINYSNVTISIRYATMHIETLMKEHNYDYNLEEIVNRYIDNEWVYVWNTKGAKEHWLK